MRALLLPYPTAALPGRTARTVIAAVQSAASSVGLDLGEYEKPMDLAQADVLIVLGSDRDVLHAFQEFGDEGVPILGLNDATGSAFLTDVTLAGLEDGLQRLVKGDYRLEACNRLAIEVDGRKTSSGLNEVAIFPSRTAVLMEYKLAVDGEEVYRDYSDGLIVATPTGSSAYAMSAGGPLVFPQSRVFILVSVNPMDIARRPLVVPDTSILRVSEISARSSCEVVIDGLVREEVDEGVEIRAGKVGNLVRIDGGSPRRMEAIRRIRSSEEIVRMPPSAKLVLKTLEYEGPLTAKEVAARALLPARTVRHAISILLQNGLVGRSPHMRDLRSDIIYIVQESQESSG